jgi:hypothetical protein
MLQTFWDELVSRRRHDEELRLLDAEIPESTKTQFVTELKKNWQEYSIFRKLAKAFGFFEDHTNDAIVPPEITPWGLSAVGCIRRQDVVRRGAPVCISFHCREPWAGTRRIGN